MSSHTTPPPQDPGNEDSWPPEETGAPQNQPVDDESSTRAVLSDAANPYHRATDRWSKAPMILTLVLIGVVLLLVLFELIAMIPGFGE